VKGRWNSLVASSPSVHSSLLSLPKLWLLPAAAGTAETTALLLLLSGVTVDSTAPSELAEGAWEPPRRAA